MFPHEIRCIVVSHIHERRSAAQLACACSDWRRAVQTDRENQVAEVMRAITTWVDPPRCVLKPDTGANVLKVDFEKGGYFELQYLSGNIHFHHHACTDDGRFVSMWFRMTWRHGKVMISRSSEQARIPASYATPHGRLIQFIEQTVRGGCKLAKQQ